MMEQFPTIRDNIKDGKGLSNLMRKRTQAREDLLRRYPQPISPSPIDVGEKERAAYDDFQKRKSLQTDKEKMAVNMEYQKNKAIAESRGIIIPSGPKREDGGTYGMMQKKKKTKWQ